MKYALRILILLLLLPLVSLTSASGMMLCAFCTVYCYNMPTRVIHNIDSGSCCDAISIYCGSSSGTATCEDSAHRLINNDCPGSGT